MEGVSFSQLITVALAVAGVAVYVVGTWAKTNREESRSLADLRGLRIADLEAERDRLIADLEALRTLRAEEIAVEVARFLYE